MPFSVPASLVVVLDGGNLERSGAIQTPPCLEGDSVRLWSRGHQDLRLSTAPGSKVAAQCLWPWSQPLLAEWLSLGSKAR